MTPEEILRDIKQRADASLHSSVVADLLIRERVDHVCRCASNRAGVRLLMACLLGKLHQPHVDPRKPYTEIGGADSFSGRIYDERHLANFINAHRLPVNSTTAFLTPALRNIDHALTTDLDLVGRPREICKKTLQLLEDVALERVGADILFVEIVRVLMLLRDEKLARMASLLDALKRTGGALPLSSQATISESMLALNSHNAADFQTGSLGDLEICLTGTDCVVTAYEMETRRVTREDIDAAAAKIARAPQKMDNYLFVTTDPIDPAVRDHAATFYEKTDGTEIAILDCIGFLQHFLHLFHRLRTDYLNAYQALVLNEPDSAVGQTLKEMFLTLRQAAESDA